MPNIEKKLADVTEARLCVTLDISRGYRQLFWQKNSQTLQSLITLNGIYSLTKVLYRTKIAVVHVQSLQSNEISANLRFSISIWLGDVLSHGFGVDDQLKFTLELFGRLFNSRSRAAATEMLFLFSQRLARVIVLSAMKVFPFIHVASARFNS